MMRNATYPRCSSASRGEQIALAPKSSPSRVGTTLVKALILAWVVIFVLWLRQPRHSAISTPGFSCPANDGVWLRGFVARPVAKLPHLFQVRGLYRSGTTYVTALLRKNHLPSLFRSVGALGPALTSREEESWKHYPPWRLSAAAVLPPALQIVVVRHPTTWISSMSSKIAYDLRCLPLHGGRCVLGNRRYHVWESFDSIEAVWNAYVQGFRALRGNWVALRYEDVLCDPEAVFRALVRFVAEEVLLNRTAAGLLRRVAAFENVAEKAKAHGHHVGYKAAREAALSSDWWDVASRRGDCKRLDAAAMAWLGYGGCAG